MLRGGGNLQISDPETGDFRNLPAASIHSALGGTEAEANAINAGKGSFLWAASGRSLSRGRPEDITRLIFDEADGSVVRRGIFGPTAGGPISGVALAAETGADTVDRGHAIHSQPTLSEAANFAAETIECTIADPMPPKRRD